MKFSILAVFVGITACAQPIPVLLQRALQRAPGLKVLDAPIQPDLLEMMKEYKCWPPWSEEDLDGDDRKDVAAVVVKGSPPDRTYGVLAVHAGAPQSIHWVVPLDKEPITGLAVDQSSAAVIPLYCFECDSNPFFRWSGTAYEMSLYQVGEEVGLYSDDESNYAGPVNLYEANNRKSRTLASRPFCAPAKVLARSGTSGNRWYRIETADSDQIRGWVPASSVTSRDCLGVLHD